MGPRSVAPLFLTAAAADGIQAKFLMIFERSAGILVHPTSFPSRGGIGDLGPAAFEFLDFLHAGSQTLWQVLPLNPTGMGNSPYSAISAFAGNPLLISLERLVEYAWLDESALNSLPAETERVDFALVNQTRLPLLRQGARTFLERPPDALGEHERFQAFCRQNSWWLHDFALFTCLRNRYKGESWNRWPRELAARESHALEQARRELAEELDIEMVLQFAFYEQWKALHSYALSKSIRIVGDVAIFVSFDSADVWTHPHLFDLDADFEPRTVAGVPPDAFSETGQRWGNPLYRWGELKRTGYEWWVRRMRWALTTCDYLRLDHFRGFQQFWEIPANEPTAINGRWVDGPQDDLFHILRTELGDLPFIAEDLGVITPDVEALRERIGMPGMKVMQFGFGDKGAHMYLPQGFVKNCVAYTGTHDNDTTIGWFQSLGAEERKNVVALLGEQGEGYLKNRRRTDGPNWAMMRAIYSSVANQVIVPLQDVLGLDGSCRMNVPSEPDGNWGWRYHASELQPSIAERLSRLTEVCDREPGAKRAR